MSVHARTVLAAFATVVICVVSAVFAGPVASGATAAAPTSAAGPTTATATTVATPPSSTLPAGTGVTQGAADTLPEPGSADDDPVRRLVPAIVAVAEVLAPAEQQPVIGAALAEGSNSIAVEGPIETLCAIVPVPTALVAGGRWERDGELLASSEDVRRDPPGYGDCLDAPGGEPFGDGVYQYVATGVSGVRSAAATVVLGTSTVAVYFTNNGAEPVCLVLVSPHAADFYEAFQTDAPLPPGQAQAVRLALAEQDVRLYGCPPDGPLRSFRFVPEGDGYVMMFDEQPAESAPADVATAGNTATTIG